MAAKWALIVVCAAACLSTSLAARNQRPVFRAVPSPVIVDVQPTKLDTEVVGSLLDPKQAGGIFIPTRTITVTQAALRSVTIIRTSTVTVSETTIINAMTATTILQTSTVIVRPDMITKTLTIQCPRASLDPTVIADVTAIPEPAVNTDAPRVEVNNTPVDSETPLKKPETIVEEPSGDEPASPAQISQLHNHIQDLMNTFDIFLSEIQLTTERQRLADRLRNSMKKVGMLRSTSAQEEFVRKLKVLLSQAAMLKANPQVFFDSVEELVLKAEKYESS